MKRIRIIKAPLESKEFGGSKTNGNMIYPITQLDQASEPSLRVASSLGPVPIDKATVEAEKGETLYVPDMGGLAAQFKVQGKKHHQGGTPMNPPDDSFFFSDTHKMKIKDPEMLKEFGKFTKKIVSGYTPAELAEQYKINDYRKVLADKYSDKLQRETAEKMIGNYNLKLGKLALTQESKKGFPEGIPVIALPYLAANSVDPNQILPLKNPEQHQMPDGSMMNGMTHAKYGGGLKYFNNGGSNTGTYMDGNYFQEGGGLPKYQAAGTVPAQVDPMTGAYAILQETLTAPENEKLRDKLYEKWKAIPENKGKTTSKTEVIDNFLKAQQQIYTIQKGTSQDALKSKSWDKGSKKNETYNKEAKRLGITPMSEDEIKTFQGAYRALSDLADDPEFEPVLKSFNLKPIGVSDQTYGKNKKAISPIDGWFGNTTVGQAVTPKVQAAPAIIEGPKVDTPGANLDPNEITKAYRRSANAPWWLQDKIKTAGAATDFMRIKKYLPWGSPVSPYIGEPTFYDPTRELAANAEIANIGTQGASTFADPNQFSAAFSGIQGAAAKNAADVLGRYNNENVTVANSFNALKSDIFNRAGEANANLAKNLYDGVTLANQNFDNAKNMARQELRSSYIDAVTNRAQTQTLNTLYPHYQVDPVTGGFLNFSKGSKVVPSSKDAFANQLEYFKKVKIADPTATWADVMKDYSGAPQSKNPMYDEVPSDIPEYLKAGMKKSNQSNVNLYNPSYNP